MAGALTLDSWPGTSGITGASYFNRFLEQMQYGMPGDPPGVLPSTPEQILGAHANEFKVFGDSSGMSVKVYQGRVYCKGIYAEIPDASAPSGHYTLDVTAAHATLYRYDTVIVEVTFATGACVLKMLDGTAAAVTAAVPTAPTQNATTWQIPLAYVIVDPTVTTIAAKDVMDSRVFSPTTRELQRVLAVDDPLVNGAFNIWDGGATIGSIGHAAYGPNNWSYSKTGAVVHDLLRSTDVPAVAEANSPLLNYSAHLDVTTADASLATTDHTALVHRIVGYAWLAYAQRAWSLSFWIKSGVLGPHAVGITNSAFDRACVLEFLVTAVDTWQYVTVHVPPSPSAGTWVYTDGEGAQLFFPQAVGPTYQSTTPGQWQTGFFMGSARTVNGNASTANNYKIAGVCSNLGNLAVPARTRSYQIERDRATQRAAGSLLMNGTVDWSRGISSLTDNGTGDVTVTFLRAFGNTKYAAWGTPQNDPGGSAATSLMVHAMDTSKTTTTCRFSVVRASDGALTDPSRLSVQAEGLPS